MRPHRLALLVLLAACGAKAQPLPLQDDGRFAKAPAFRRDAGIADAPRVIARSDATIELADASVVAVATANDAGAAAEPAPPSKYKSVKDALADEGVVYDPKGGIVDTYEPDEIDKEVEGTYEDGVLVRPSKAAAWCARGGKYAGWCTPTKAACSKLTKSCVSTKTYACFWFTARTSGKEDLLCFETYGKCEGIRRGAALSDEYSVDSDCIVFRHKAKK